MATSLAKKQQKEFDDKYITSHEIAQSLGISRTAITYARRRGTLPTPILIPGTKSQVWIRADLKPILAQWKTELKARKK